MEKYRFRSAGREVEINYTSLELNKQFEKLYASYFSGGVLRWQEFKKYAFLFFDNEGSEVEQARAFFQNFTVVCNQFLQQGEYDQVESIWQKSLDIVREWEEENDERLHKGTPYYFYGMACILNNEIEKGFLLMHNALEEDKVTRGTDDPDTPANYFVKLDPEQPAQAFRVKVTEVANFLKGYLEHYRNERGNNLNFQDFQDNFLDNRDLENTVFSFMYNLFQVQKSLESGYPRPQDGALRPINGFATAISIHHQTIPTVLLSFLLLVISNVVSYHVGGNFIPDRTDKVPVFPELPTPEFFLHFRVNFEYSTSTYTFRVPTTLETLYRGGKERNR